MPWLTDWLKISRIGMQLRRRRQNNSTSLASRFLVHSFDVHCTTTTWNLFIWWRTWTCDDEFSFLFFNLNKILTNSIPGKVSCLLHLKERKFIFFTIPTFSLPSSTSLLKSLMTQKPNPNVKSLQKENDSTASFFLPCECVPSPPWLAQLLANRWYLKIVFV